MNPLKPAWKHDKERLEALESEIHRLREVLSHIEASNDTQPMWRSLCFHILNGRSLYQWLRGKCPLQDPYIDYEYKH